MGKKEKKTKKMTSSTEKQTVRMSGSSEKQTVRRMGLKTMHRVSRRITPDNSTTFSLSVLQYLICLRTRKTKLSQESNLIMTTLSEQTFLANNIISLRKLVTVFLDKVVSSLMHNLPVKSILYITSYLTFT